MSVPIARCSRPRLSVSVRRQYLTMLMSDPKWKRFERLIAAIHQVDAQGAQISWNETINGRQFDVVLRFSIGSYRYLTVIECKDQKRSVSVDEVEAFVTKSRDAGADKAVLVSSSGYQEGAFQVAERHHIELFGLSFVKEMPPDLLHQALFPCMQIYQMKLRRSDDASWLNLPDDRNLPLTLRLALPSARVGKCDGSTS